MLGSNPGVQKFWLWLSHLTTSAQYHLASPSPSHASLSRLTSSGSPSRHPKKTPRPFSVLCNVCGPAHSVTPPAALHTESAGPMQTFLSFCDEPIFSLSLPPPLIFSVISKIGYCLLPAIWVKKSLQRWGRSLFFEPNPNTHCENNQRLLRSP